MNYCTILTSWRSVADENRAEQVRFLAEKIVAQIAALNREAATQALRQKEQSYVKRDSQVDLYQRLAQHQDYERRLAQMTDDRELALGRAQTFAEQQKSRKSWRLWPDALSAAVRLYSA